MKKYAYYPGCTLKNKAEESSGPVSKIFCNIMLSQERP